ncbi:MAG: serine/threonine-protein kinase [Planctomycetota bacterium]
MSEPSLLRGLSEQQQVRLTELLDRYLQQLEEGKTPNREVLLPDDASLSPELRQALDLYLDKLGELYQMVDGRSAPIGSDLAGKVLGDYRLEQEIGRGGMGIVFTAFDISLKRQVAIKLLPMAAMLEPKYVDRFRGEAQAAASLEHPNIVPVYAVGEDSGIHYYAMRLIDGQSLDQRIAKHKNEDTQPASRSALMQFADIADALHEVHLYGIVHRDIKPSNLLLDQTGKLWVADFGLARFQGEHALTRTGEMVGTMRYMSPEQAQGRGELVDHRTDIYSLGATLYELLTGQPAVPGEEGAGLLRTLTTQNPTRLRKLRPDLAPEFQIVVERAMARHRDDRYATASDLAADLRKVARGEPITTKSVSSVVRATRWAQAHPRAVSVLIASTAMFALLVTTGFYMHNRLLASVIEQSYRDLAQLQALETDKTIDALTKIPGAEGVRQSLIQQHQQYYTDFVSRPLVDASTQLPARADAYNRLGTYSEEFGDIPAAVLNYEKAKKIYEQVVTASDFSNQKWIDRSDNLNRLALALRKAGQGHRGAELLESWASAIKQVGSLDELPIEHRSQYGLTENNLGLLLQSLAERADEARSAYDRALYILQKLQQENPDDSEIRRTLAATKHNLGSLLAKDPASRQQAFELLEAAYEAQIQLVKESESPFRAYIDLVATYISLGNLQLDSNPQEAARIFENVVAIGRKLVEMSPKVDDYRRDLAVSLSNLGMAYYRTGDLDNAKASLKESVHSYRLLRGNHPDNAGLQYSLGIALNNQGIVLQHIGEPRAAEEAYVRAARLLEANEPTPLEALNNVYQNHVRMLRKEGRDAEAQELEQRQLALKSSRNE